MDWNDVFHCDDDDDEMSTKHKVKNLSSYPDHPYRTNDKRVMNSFRVFGGLFYMMMMITEHDEHKYEH